VFWGPRGSPSLPSVRSRCVADDSRGPRSLCSVAVVLPRADGRREGPSEVTSSHSVRAERRGGGLLGRTSFLRTHTRPTVAREPSPEVYRAVREARKSLIAFNAIRKGKGLHSRKRNRSSEPDPSIRTKSRKCSVRVYRAVFRRFRDNDEVGCIVHDLKVPCSRRQLTQQNRDASCGATRRPDAAASLSRAAQNTTSSRRRAPAARPRGQFVRRRRRRTS
jgi:hypothetical protein